MPDTPDHHIAEIEALRLAKHLGLKPLHVFDSPLGSPFPSSMAFASVLAASLSAPQYERDSLGQMIGGGR